MQTVYLLLLLASFACFVAEALRGDRTRFDLVAAGLAFAVAVPVLVQVDKVF